MEQTPPPLVAFSPGFTDRGQGNTEAGRKGPWGAGEVGGLPLLEDAEVPREKGLQNLRPQELELRNARYIFPALQN